MLPIETILIVGKCDVKKQKKHIKDAKNQEKLLQKY